MKLKFMLKFFIIICLTTFAYIIIGASYENIYTYNKIEEFKKECTQIESNNKYIKLYNVSRETEASSFEFRIYGINPGAPLDIIIKLESTFDLWCTPFINFFIGGHAAICADNYKDDNISLTNYDVIETTYNEAHKEVFVSSKVYWENITFTDKYIILRVKGLTDDEKSIALKKAISMLGDPYNLTFITNTKNTHYCSDLVTKTFKSVGKNTNYDGFATTIYDLLVSSSTEIVGYKEFDPNTQISSYYGVNLI